MLRSMTGFGRFEAADDAYKLTVEVRGVNHRYLDLNLKLPKKFGAFDGLVRQLVKESVQRGKVDLFLTYEELGDGSAALQYHKATAEAYVNALSQIEKDFGLMNPLTARDIAAMPDVLVPVQPEEDEEALGKLLETAVRGALAGFVKMRENEGEQLGKDLLEKLSLMETWVDRVEERAPGIVKDYRSRLEEKVREVLEDRAVDEARLLTEVTIFSDKVCTDEETVRLRTHIKHMRADLQSGGPVGRRLDFIAQEMNREANTILSKSNDMETSAVAIDLKTEIEKVREQVQNIE